MKVCRISAIILKVKDMGNQALYSKIPGFRFTYGRKPSAHFITFEIGKVNDAVTATYVNSEHGIRKKKKRTGLKYKNYSNLGKSRKGNEDFGRVIFHTENVDELYWYVKNDEHISKLVI